MSAERIGLTGGIATGKSTVAKMLAALGAVILDADQVAREVVEPEAPGWHALRDLLGPEYFNADGRLKRRKLRERIIADARVREQVSAALHPLVRERMDAEWRAWRTNSPGKPVIFDIPLLFETGQDARFGAIILVYAPPEVQIQRLMARDHLTRAEAEATLAMQLPIESKKSRSHLIIDNSGTLEHTRCQVEELWETIEAKL